MADIEPHKALRQDIDFIQAEFPGTKLVGSFYLAKHERRMGEAHRKHLLHMQDKELPPLSREDFQKLMINVERVAANQASRVAKEKTSLENPSALLQFIIRIEEFEHLRDAAIVRQRKTANQAVPWRRGELRQVETAEPPIPEDELAPFRKDLEIASHFRDTVIESQGFVVPGLIAGQRNVIWPEPLVRTIDINGEEHVSLLHERMLESSYQEALERIKEETQIEGIVDQRALREHLNQTISEVLTDIGAFRREISGTCDLGFPYSDALGHIRALNPGWTPPPSFERKAQGDPFILFPDPYLSTSFSRVIPTDLRCSARLLGQRMIEEKLLGYLEYEREIAVTLYHEYADELPADEALQTIENALAPRGQSGELLDLFEDFSLSNITPGKPDFHLERRDELVALLRRVFSKNKEFLRRYIEA